MDEFLSSSPNFGVLEEDLFQMMFSEQHDHELDHHHHHHYQNGLVNNVDDMWTAHHVLEDDHDHHVTGNCSSTAAVITNKKKKKKRSAAAADLQEAAAADDPKKKKIIHREVERQRRQEMATLYSSLRTMLPLHYLKGKRSISDHMHEAVNYIKHLQSRIQELKNKREEVEKCSSCINNLGQNCLELVEQNYYAQVEEAIVRPCLVGVEVVISTRWTLNNLKQQQEEPLPLSAILQLLAREGLTLVSCVSTKLNQAFVHTILTQVNCWQNMDLLKLQQKLKRFRVPLSYVNNRSNLMMSCMGFL